MITSLCAKWFLKFGVNLFQFAQSAYSPWNSCLYASRSGTTVGTHPLHSIYLCGLTLTHLNTYFLFGLKLTFFAKYYLENWGVQLIGVGELGVGIDSASYHIVTFNVRINWSQDMVPTNIVIQACVCVCMYVYECGLDVMHISPQKTDNVADSF